MIIRTTGIVIREQLVGEQDRLVTILTKENGVIKGFVNGSRNPKNKNAAATGLLCYSDFSIEKTKANVYRIQEATAIEVFFSLRENILELSLAQYFAEIIFELSPREEDSTDFLKLMLNSLYMLVSKKRSMQLVKSAIELRLLCLAGYMPSIINCQNCGEFESDPMYFCIKNGELFCKNCKPDERHIILPIGVITAIRHICFSEQNKIYNFTLSEKGMQCLNEVSELYLKSITMRKFKTLEFYKLMTD